MKQSTHAPTTLSSSPSQTTTQLFLLLLLLLLLMIQPTPTLSSSFYPTHSTTPNNTNNPLDLTYIKTSCKATLYPQLCYTSLSRYASSVQQNPARLAIAAIVLSLSRAGRLSSFLSNASRHADYSSSSSNHRAVSALHDCSSNVGDALEEIRGSLKQMRGAGTEESGRGEEEFRFRMSNVQTWMSAALTDEETCTDGFSDVADGTLKTEVCERVGVVKKFTSNALALVNSYANGRAS